MLAPGQVRTRLLAADLTDDRSASEVQCDRARGNRPRCQCLPAPAAESAFGAGHTAPDPTRSLRPARWMMNASGTCLCSDTCSVATLLAVVLCEKRFADCRSDVLLGRCVSFTRNRGRSINLFAGNQSTSVGFGCSSGSRTVDGYFRVSPDCCRFSW